MSREVNFRGAPQTPPTSVMANMAPVESPAATLPPANADAPEAPRDEALDIAVGIARKQPVAQM
jgi:hypothetical protein